MNQDFGDRYVYEEWKDIFDAVFEAFNTEDDVDLSASIDPAHLCKPRTVRLVEDAMTQLGLSCSATRTYVPSADSSSRNTRRARPPPKKRLKMASIFLDIDADVDDEEEEEQDGEEEEEDIRRRLPSLEPAGHASYAQRLAQVVQRYETGNSTSGVGSACDPAILGHLLLNDNGQRIYTIALPTSKLDSIVHFTSFKFLHTSREYCSIPPSGL